MKPRAFLFFLWDKHFPVIKAVLERYPDHLALIPNSGSLASPLLRPFGGRIIPLDGLVSKEERDALILQALEKGSFLESFAETPGWADFCREASVPAGAAAEGLGKDIRNQGFPENLLI